MTYDDREKQLAASVDALKDEARDRLAAVSENVRRESNELGRALKATAGDLADTAAVKLREAGVDTDKLVDTARDQASELQRALIAEIKARPLRAIGVAAAVGMVFGLLTAR